MSFVQIVCIRLFVKRPSYNYRVSYLPFRSFGSSVSLGLGLFRLNVFVAVSSSGLRPYDGTVTVVVLCAVVPVTRGCWSVSTLLKDLRGDRSILSFRVSEGITLLLSYRVVKV